MTVKSVSGSVLTVTDDGAEESYHCDSKTKVTLDGKPAKLGELKAGDDVDVESDGQATLRVAATRP